MDTNTISTGFFTDRAMHLINAAMSNIKDRSSGITYRTLSIAKAQRDPDGSVIIALDKNYSIYRTVWFKSNSEDAARDWLANKIKAWVRMVCQSNDIWQRSCTTVVPQSKFRATSDDMPMTVNELYLVYDILKNRKNIENKYSPELIKAIVGERNNPIMTELETNRREEIEKIKANLRAELLQLDRNKYDEISKSRKDIELKYANLKTEAENNAKKAIDDLNTALTAALELNVS